MSAACMHGSLIINRSTSLIESLQKVASYINGIQLKLAKYLAAIYHIACDERARYLPMGYCKDECMHAFKPNDAI